MTGPHPGRELDTLLRLVAPPDALARPAAALPWAPVGTGSRGLLAHAARRCATAVRVRATAAVTGRQLAVVRPTRGSLRPGWRDELRRRAGSGYVAFRPATGSVVAHVLREAGAVALSGPAVGADGAVRLPVRSRGRAGLLRMGLAGSPADPSGAAAGLALLEAHGVARVPRVLGEGTSADVVWVLEELLPGRRPAALTAGLTGQVAAFLAALPASGDLPRPADDAAVVAPVAGASDGAVHAAADAVAASPPAGRAGLGHGDLWTGNVLVDGERLTGVVDWDSWSPARLPGVDLLHLLATERRISTRAALGEVWLQRPWDDPVFVAAAVEHWPDWGGDPAARRLVGVAWWLGQLAGDLRRNPALGDDGRWVARNVTAVAAAL